MPPSEEVPIGLEERVSNEVVKVIAPVLERLAKEEGKNGLMLLATSLITAGSTLLQSIVGDTETTEFLKQLLEQIKVNSRVD
jgi:hypothetical protein